MNEFNAHFKNPAVTYCDKNVVTAPIDEFTSTVEATLFSAKVETGADGPMVVLTAYATDSDTDTDRIVWRLKPNTVRRLRNWFNKIVMQVDGDDAKKELDALSKYAQDIGGSNE